MQPSVFAIFALLAVAAARAPPSFQDTINELEAREQASDWSKEAQKQDSRVSHLRFNRASESKEPASELSAADASADAQVVQEEADKIDAFGHPKSDTMESNANHFYEA